MRFELDNYRRNVPESVLIADLRRVASELGKTSLSRDEYKTLGEFSSSCLEKRLGGWSVAIGKAELEKPKVQKRIRDEELFRNVEEVWTRLGRQPRRDELKGQGSAYNSGTYEKRFGSWRNALEAFISYINGEQSAASDDEIERLRIETIRKRKTPRKIKGEEASLSSGATEGTQQGTRSINWRLRFIVMRRDNFKCKACGRSPATDPTIILHVDHIEAWSRDGKTVLENLQTLCSVCNIGKSDLDFQEAR
jgi:hypothetical protein